MKVVVGITLSGYVALDVKATRTEINEAIDNLPLTDYNMPSFLEQAMNMDEILNSLEMEITDIDFGKIK